MFSGGEVENMNKESSLKHTKQGLDIEEYKPNQICKATITYPMCPPPVLISTIKTTEFYVSGASKRLSKWRGLATNVRISSEKTN